MPKLLLLNTDTNTPEEVDSTDVRQALASGKYREYREGNNTLDIGTQQVPVSLSSRGGQELDAINLGLPASSNPGAFAELERQRLLAAQYDNARDKIATFGEGVLDAMSVGVYEGEQGFEGDARREALGGYGTAGKALGIAGSAFTGAAPLGALGKASAAVGARAAARLGGGAAARAVGAGVEGALFGAADEGAQQLADVLLRDKPLVAERLVSAVTVGGLLGAGTSAALSAASKAVKAARPGVKDTVKAIVSDEQRAAINSGITDSKAALDGALDDMASRFRVLEAYRQDVAKGVAGVAGTAEAAYVAGLDDTWYTVRDKAIKSAVNAKKKVERWNPERILDMSPKALKNYSKDWLEYERSMAKMQDLAGFGPEGWRGLPAALDAAAPPATSLPSVADDGATVAGKKIQPPVPTGPDGTRILPRGSREVTKLSPAKQAVQDFEQAATQVTQLPSNDFLRRILDDWDVQGAAGNGVGKVSEAAARLSTNARAIAEANQFLGSTPEAAAMLGVDGLLGNSTYLDSVIDAWTSNQMANQFAKAANKGTTTLEKSAKRSGRSRYGADFGRWSVRREVNEGLVGQPSSYAGYLAGSAAHALISGGAIAKLAGWAETGALSTAAAVESLLGSGRAAAGTRLLTAMKVSYTGDDADATDDPRVKGEQLGNILSNEQALRNRLRANLEPIGRVSPDLAQEMEDIQVSRLRNLALRAPQFLLAPGATPPAPFGAEFDAFNQYERVTQDPDYAIRALKTSSLTRAMADAFREQHPVQYQRAVATLVGNLTEERLRNMTRLQRQQITLLIGPGMFPSAGVSQQAAYAANKQNTQQTLGGPPNPRAMPRASTGQQMMAPPPRPGN
jgi:hypothetical protein